MKTDHVIKFKYACVFPLMLFSALSPSSGGAEEVFPVHPIKFVIPFPPGGGTDTLARFVAHAMEKEARQSIVVENKPGAGSAIAISAVANAPADGYTILVGAINMVTSPYLYKKFTNDIKSLVPLAGLAYAPTVVVTTEKERFHDMKDLISYSKNNPKALNYASYGVGSSPDLGTKLLSQATGFDATHIPYQGGGPAINSVLSGQTDVLLSSVLPVLPHIQSGRLKALGVTSEKRLKSLPDTPTLKEQGIDLQTGTWFGFFINAETPPSTMAKLENLINKAIEEKKVQDYIIKEGAEPMLGGRSAFVEFVEKEDKRWSQVIKTEKISVD